MICTFYSYKGGVGRSMAMANVADILARRGRRVLMIDFDLEAPGLEQFFHANIEGVRRHPGLVDLLLSYKQSMSVTSGEAAFKNVDGFIVPIYEQLPGGGRLDLMPAGQRQDAEQLARYALALRTFDWQDFYYNWEGDLFFEWLRRSLGAPRYDITLVDSRTGVTEMGGICGYQLADVIVMLCAPNNQNVQGTANMLRDFRSASVEGLRRGRPLDIMVVPARVEQRDPALLDDFFQRFDASFGGITPEPLVAAGIRARDLMIPYEPLYAFQERVVSDPERVDDRHRIGAVFERLADAVALLGEPPSGPGDTARSAGAAAPSPTIAAPIAETKYDATRRFAGYDVYLDASRTDESEAAGVVSALRARGLEVFVDREDIVAGAEWVAVAEEALFHSRALLVCVGASELSEWRQTLLRKAADARGRGQNLTIIPVLLPGSSPRALEGTPLAGDVQPLDFRQGIDAASLDRLVPALRGPTQAQVETEARAPYVGQGPLDEQHADLFFGRESAVRRALATIDSATPLLVTGPSGCGKTSLVRAGLFPALRAQAPTWRWTIASLSIATRPLAALAEARATRPREGGARWLLFVDQLEKLGDLAADERAQFLRDLAELSTRAEDRPSIVLAVRSDARAAVVKMAGPLELLVTAGVLELGPLSPDDLRRVVAAPAERVGLAFEPGLVDRIVADLRSGSASLGLAQQLLLELWQKRRNGWLTNAAYADLGGMPGLVARRADEIYAGLADLEQRAMRSIMLRLVRLGEGGESTRRRVPRRVLAPETADAAHASGPSTRVLDVLIDAGLLVTGEDGGEPVVEAAHEALVRGWPPLQRWLEDEREFLEWRERLAAAMSTWESAGRSPELLLRDAALSEAERRLGEQGADLSAGEAQYIAMSTSFREARAARRDRLRRYVTGGAVLVAIAALLLSTFAWIQRQEAFRQRQLADEGAKLAQAQADDAKQQAQSATESLARVREQLEALARTAAQANQERDLAAAERQRAEAALRELRKTLTTVQQLEKEAERAQTRSGQNIRAIEDLRQQIKK